MRNQITNYVTSYKEWNVEQYFFFFNNLHDIKYILNIIEICLAKKKSIIA